MEKQSFMNLTRIRQAVTYILMCVGLGLLITLGMHGLRQINDKQVVEGKPYQVLAAESNKLLTDDAAIKDTTDTTLAPVDEPLSAPNAQPPAVLTTVLHESEKGNQGAKKILNKQKNH